MKSYQPAYIKAQNRKLVYELFLRERELSRVQITKLTGMSFPTAMKVVDFLLSKGLISESGDTLPGEEGLGRKSRVLRLNPRAYMALGVEFEGRYAKLGLVDMCGEISYRDMVEVEDFAQKRDLSALIEAMQSILSRSKAGNILGVGIGFPGHINPDSGSLMRYTALGITCETTFRSLFPKLYQEIGLPVFWENDVNLACIGEGKSREKSGKKESLCYLALGTGLGCGILLPAGLYRGARFCCGEVGHFLLGPLRDGGPAPIEESLGLRGLEKYFGISLMEDKALTRQMRESLMDYLCAYLAPLCYNLACLMDLDTYVLAGITPALLGKSFYTRLNQKLEELYGMEEGKRVELPQCTDAGIVGGAEMVFNRLLSKLLEDE